ncbi:hypothetical protein [Lysobacter koreensis]|uniref:hypothetical protein n=1 Tax=Lysobacter koreensis TaxID=266122 RepID=UPI0036DC63E0
MSVGIGPLANASRRRGRSGFLNDQGRHPLLLRGFPYQIDRGSEEIKGICEKAPDKKIGPVKLGRYSHCASA